MAEKRPFVLSGGGARGFAHLGVLKAFEEKGITPQIMAATSAGSIAAAFLCDGYTTDEIAAIFHSAKIGLSPQWRDWKRGLLSLKDVAQILTDKLTHKYLEELPVPLHIAATNFISGDQHIFSTGEIIPAVLAACSIPIIFPPVEIEQIPYVDGGLSGNLPAEPLLGKYENIIGVHVNPLSDYHQNDGFLANIDRTLHLGIREAAFKHKDAFSLFIEPEGLSSFGVFDFKHFTEIYTIGLEYTRKLLQHNS